MHSVPELIERLGGLSYVGIFFVAMLANVVIPVPEEIVLLALGYIARAGHIDIFVLLPVIMGGVLLGDCVVYFLSRRRVRLVSYFYDRIFSKRLPGKKRWVEENVERVIFFSRFLIRLWILGPLVAGHERTSFRVFLTYELAALVLYVPLVTLCGWYFHSRIERIAEGVGLARNIILIVAGIIFIVLLFRSIRRRTLGTKAPADITKPK